MGLFDFFKGKSKSKKPKTLYDDLNSILSEGSKDSNSALQFYSFAYVNFPKSIFNTPNEILTKIYNTGKEEVIVEYTKSCFNTGTMPKPTDINEISVKLHESKQQKISIINFPIIENAIHNGLPILAPIKIGIYHNANKLKYFTVGMSPSKGIYTLREVFQSGSANLGQASGLSDEAFISDIKNIMGESPEMEIEKILRNSLQNLNLRQGGISLQDFETEVIYNACKFIIENYKNEISTVNDVNLINTVISKNEKHQNIAKMFIEAGTKILPEKYTLEHQNAAKMLIVSNISWNGMWDYLRDYFQKKHGISIDSVKAEPLIFYSTKHVRLENNQIVSEVDVERNVNINFFENREKIIISIEPTLSAKTAFLHKKNENKWIYLGEDPDYKFIVYFDKFEELDKVILELPNRKLKLVYT